MIWFSSGDFGYLGGLLGSYLSSCSGKSLYTIFLGLTETISGSLFGMTGSIKTEPVDFLIIE